MCDNMSLGMYHPPSSAISTHADHIKPHFVRVTEMGNIIMGQ
jgi:hypothetical protein